MSTPNARGRIKRTLQFPSAAQYKVAETTTRAEDDGVTWRSCQVLVVFLLQKKFFRHYGWQKHEILSQSKLE